MSKVWLMIGLGAAITFFLRAFPFLIFHGERKIPSWLETLGKNLPPAIMAVLVVYCLKDVRGNFTQTGIRQIAAGLVVAVTYKWKHNTLFSILIGMVVYMVLLWVR